MKTIKLRAWDTQLKTYSYSGYGEKTFSIFVKRTNCKRYIIEQFTGLKDKNNKSIYAGDIYKCYQLLVESRKQIYKEHIRVVEYTIDNLYRILCISESTKGIEIIGNIHVFSKLLKNTEK